MTNVNHTFQVMPANVILNLFQDLFYLFLPNDIHLLLHR